MKYGMAGFFLMGISTPPMLIQAFEGKLPWSDVFAYMAILAFLGTISGMAIMSLNYPFMAHTFSYTISGIILAVLSCKESGIVKSLKSWQNKQESLISQPP